MKNSKKITAAVMFFIMSLSLSSCFYGSGGYAYRPYGYSRPMYGYSYGGSYRGGHHGGYNHGGRNSHGGGYSHGGGHHR